LLLSPASLKTFRSDNTQASVIKTGNYSVYSYAYFFCGYSELFWTFYKLFQQNPNVLICYKTSIFLQLDRCMEFCPSATLSTQNPTWSVDQSRASKPCNLTQCCKFWGASSNLTTITIEVSIFSLSQLWQKLHEFSAYDSQTVWKPNKLEYHSFS